METFNTAPTILVVDDEPEIRKILTRFLMKQGYQTLQASNGRDAIGIAKVQQPQILLLDLNMPEIDGLNVCKQLRENPATRLTPILMLTARAAVEDRILGLNIGADDYLPKPFDLGELQARIEVLLKRCAHMIAANPLTHLPGTPLIQKEIELRITTQESLGVAYIDIDHFKAYNDVYGYNQGDEIILWTAKLLEKNSENIPSLQSQHKNFIGHIGGDDFILVSDAITIDTLCKSIADEFDQHRASWYNFFHRIQKCIRTQDRQGNECSFPLMSLSIAISTNQKRKITHFGQVAGIITELKKFIKNRADQNKSAVVIDRRIS